MPPDTGGVRFRGVEIPEGELVWSFTTSGGPGGQHANRSNTAVELRFNVRNSPALPDRLRDRILRRMAGQLTRQGEVVVQAAETRSQTRNRDQARRRLATLLTDATAPPEPPRRPTRPSRRAKQRRLDRKKQRGQLKAQRRTPDWP